MKKLLAKGVGTLALLSLSSLAGAQTPTAQLTPANTIIAPGGSASIPVLVTYNTTSQNGLTVGRFTVTLTPATAQNSLPSITELKAGTATQSALSGQDCSNAPCTSTDLATNPSTPSGTVVTAALLLPSKGSTGNEQGGVIGTNQEIAKVLVTLPAGVPKGQVYNVALSNENFSTASSQQVQITHNAATLTVGDVNVILTAGSTTAYTDPTNTAGIFAMVPTDSAFPTTGGAGYRTYQFNVSATNLNGNVVQWAVVPSNVPAPDPNNPPFDPYTSGQLTQYQGSFTTNADGTQLTYSPAPAAMKMDRALRLTFTATVPSAPNNPSVNFVATLYPYGDADLDGAVTAADFVLTFRWSNGNQLPFVPAGADVLNLPGYIGVNIQRLLTDVRDVPGANLDTSLAQSWNGELQKSGQSLDLTAYNRGAHAFGDGAVTSSDAIWIFRKSNNNGAGKTLDPRVDLTPAQDF